MKFTTYIYLHIWLTYCTVGSGYVCRLWHSYGHIYLSLYNLRKKTHVWWYVKTRVTGFNIIQFNSVILYQFMGSIYQCFVSIHMQIVDPFSISQIWEAKLFKVLVEGKDMWDSDRFLNRYCARPGFYCPFLEKQEVNFTVNIDVFSDLVTYHVL